MNTQAKVILSAEDRTAAAFASAMRGVDKLGLNFDTLKASAIGALSAMAVPVSVAGIATVFNESRRAIDGLQDLADASGSSVEAISALDNIARSTGGNLDTVSSILVKFNGVLAEARPDKGVGATLKAIGLSVEELRRLDPAEALRTAAVAVEKLGSETDKARVYQELFGKSVRDAAPFLKDLAEAKRLDATLTADQVEQVDKFNKEMAKLQATATNVGRSFSIGLVTEINSVIRKFEEAEKAGKSFLSVLFLSPAEMDRKNRSAGAFGLKPESERGVSGPIIDPTDPRAVLRQIERQQDTRPRASVLPPPAASAPGGKSSDAAREAQRAEKEHADWLRSFEKAEYDYRDRLFNKRMDDEEKALREHAEWIKSMEDATGEYVYQRNIKRLEDEEKAREDAAKKAADAQVAQVERLGDAFTSTFDRAFTEGMKVGDLIKKLAFDAINIQFLTPATQKIGSSLGKAVTSLFSFDGGGYTGSGSRSGGIDGKGGFLSVLHPNETVLDHTRGQGIGGGGVTIQQNFNFGNATADTVAQLRAEAARIKAETLAAVPGVVLQARRTSTGFANALRGG